MAERLPRVTAGEALRALERDGWTIVRQSGTSHAILRHPRKRGRTVIPRHARAILKPGILAAILEDVGLTVREFRELL
ncbi:MAG: type II toxin-antitoxin system HicA family toxin [Dehalococcoidia bacterium]